MAEKKAVIFDCWNTLFQNEGENPYKTLADNLGYSLDDYEGYVKPVERHLMLEKHETESDLEQAIEVFYQEVGVDYNESDVRETRELLESAADNVVAYPETQEVLDYLDGNYRLGFISNTNFRAFQGLTQEFDVEDTFDVIFLSYREGVMKPDAEVFETVLSELDVMPGEAVMVGDSLPDDVQAAEEQGIDGILMDRNRRHSEYDDRIESLAELKAEL